MTLPSWMQSTPVEMLTLWYVLLHESIACVYCNWLCLGAGLFLSLFLYFMILWYKVITACIQVLTLQPISRYDIVLYHISIVVSSYHNRSFYHPNDEMLSVSLPSLFNCRSLANFIVMGNLCESCAKRRQC